MTTTLDVVELPWATSKNLLYTLEAGSSARSGTIKLHLDNASSRFSWTGELNVEALAEPTLTFVSLELQDGTTFTNPQGSCTHPSGENLKFTWLPRKRGRHGVEPQRKPPFGCGPVRRLHAR